MAEGIAGGLLFSIGDISVKVATQGGARTIFAIGVVLGYLLGTALALPISAGTVVLGEPMPSGVFGGLRIVAFAAVTLGAILLARPDRGAALDPYSGT